MSGLIPEVSIGDGPQPIALTPTQRIVQDANRVEFGIDSRGRKLGVQRMGLSVQRRVLKALSAESGSKASYFNLAVMACCCVSIDGTPIPFPQSELQVDGLIDRLEQEGLETVSAVLAEHFLPPSGADLKNS